MIGTKKAAVFPEPVGAQANICLFYQMKKINKCNIDTIQHNKPHTCNMTGIAWVWIGVGTE